MAQDENQSTWHTTDIELMDVEIRYTHPTNTVLVILYPTKTETELKRRFSGYILGQTTRLTTPYYMVHVIASVIL